MLNKVTGTNLQKEALQLGKWELGPSSERFD
jgi:hypothetical protein